MLYRSPPSTPLHVMAFAETLQGGGVERALLRMAAGWLARGHRVTLVLGACEGPLAAELPAGIELIELGSPHYPILLRLPRVVRKVDPDILFCPGNYYTAVAAFVRLRLGRRAPPIVAKVSNALVRPEMWPMIAWGYNRWLRWHPWFLDHVVAMTPAMAREAITEMAIAPERVSVIANPRAERIADAVPIALPPSRYIVGVGRLEPQKRWDRLIDALPRLSDPSIRLLLLGEGSARAPLEAQVARLGLADRVTMPGHVSDPLPALKHATVAALTSDYEGVPGVVREALSQGTPVVATEASVAVRELIDSPTLGTVVPREDGDALAAALDHWIEPGRPRPAPPEDEGDPIGDYLALFSKLARQRIA